MVWWSWLRLLWLQWYPDDTYRALWIIWCRGMMMNMRHWVVPYSQIVSIFFCTQKWLQVVDPPFIVKAVWEKYAEAARLLLKTGSETSYDGEWVSEWSCWLLDYCYHDDDVDDDDDDETFKNRRWDKMSIVIIMR